MNWLLVIDLTITGAFLVFGFGIVIWGIIEFRSLKRELERYNK